MGDENSVVLNRSLLTRILRVWGTLDSRVCLGVCVHKVSRPF